MQTRPPSGGVEGDTVLELDIEGPLFYDKVYGCWLGKNAGGTLGTPLEKTFGEPEPFDVWWYPKLAEGGGGLPNDDLEIQLAWLKALEEVGPHLSARDLARYWLDHVGYNFDEYGLSKTNLRLGLEPPISGHYNNWFKDCMGCPIRSEIWACVAPAVPRVAARYAYQDAICDHAGGESVYGELFNVAVESAAFVVSDRRALVDIGLSYVPDDSKTAAAIRAVLAAHDEGLDWKAARRRVLETTPHYNAQYSPINLGFQVIGLLYGEDFGDGICKTVNCGYDTDSSGAAIGSYLGILAGRSGLPAKWIEPLGDTIATNESWGGVRHLSDGDNPIPANLDELVTRIRRVARTVLSTHGALDADGVVRVSETDLYADDEVRALRDSSPTLVSFPSPDLHVGVDYVDTPAVAPDTTKTIVTTLTNPHPDPIVATCAVTVPTGWEAPAAQEVEVPARGRTELTWRIDIPGRALLHNSNRCFVAVSPRGRPAQPAVPLVLVGAAAIRVSGPYDRNGRSDTELLDTAFPPEQRTGALEEPDSRGGEWRELSAHDNALPLDEVFDGPGVLYVQSFIHAPEAQRVWLAVDANCPVRFWVNDDHVATAERYQPIRPNYGGRADSASSVTLRAGWNELLVKLVRNADAPAAQCHVLISSDDRFRDGQPHLGRTRFPWD